MKETREGTEHMGRKVGAEAMTIQGEIFKNSVVERNFQELSC